MSYIDSYVLPLEPAKKEAYLKIATLFRDFAREQGALAYFEAISDDAPRGKHTDFYRAVDAQDGEEVVTAYVVWKDKTARDAAMEAMHKDERFTGENAEMPFDGKRMFWGGFEPIIEL